MGQDVLNNCTDFHRFACFACQQQKEGDDQDVFEVQAFEVWSDDDFEDAVEVTAVPI